MKSTGRTKPKVSSQQNSTHLIQLGKQSTGAEEFLDVRRQNKKIPKCNTFAEKDLSIACINIISPKRETDTQKSKSDWFSFYAGYSFDFAESIIRTANLAPDSVILDPWNGGGTTTTTATHCGFESIGFDRNPAMIVVAKARLVSILEQPTIAALSKTIVSELNPRKDKTTHEPLSLWFTEKTAESIRAIERSIHHCIVDPNSKSVSTLHSETSSLSPISAFYLLALFKVVRKLLGSFRSSNPTWVKKAALDEKLNIDGKIIRLSFLDEVSTMLASLETGASWLRHPARTAKIQLGDSRKISLDHESVDLTLTSPPYCTRIDYAVATSPELAVLGLGDSKQFDAFRKELIGTTAIRAQKYEVSTAWGETCQRFIEASRSHTSKASDTYYHKSHLQYFHALYTSVHEIYKVTKSHGFLIAVVQDSYYKNIHNDLPRIFTDMALNIGFSASRKDDFIVSRLLSGVNPRAKKYLSHRSAIESVLVFHKP